jgi:non-lysosomal glucosylceramidase
VARPNGDNELRAAWKNNGAIESPHSQAAALPQSVRIEPERPGWIRKGIVVSLSEILTPIETGPDRPADIPVAAWKHPIGGRVLDAGRAVQGVTPVLIDDGPDQGLPLGGLGSGSIGRTHRGDFARWHLEIGKHHYQTAYANQFSVYVERDDERLAQVLCTERPADQLQDWQWEYPRGAGSYYALFPRAWFDYTWEALPIRLTQEQLSPVIPGNDRESCLPVGAFEWRVENPGDRPVKIGLMLTWENLLGSALVGGQAPSLLAHNRNSARRDGHLIGVELRRDHPFSGAAWDGSLAIATVEMPGVTVSYRSRFVIDESGAELWRDFADDGRLDNRDDPQLSGDERIGAALAVSFELAPGESKAIPFAVAWDLPVVAFPDGARWHKRYTRFYGDSGGNAWEIATDALRYYRGWRREIKAWQQPILDDPQRPEWYKTALFNELYYLIDGGTLWVDGPLDAPENQRRSGLFAYLECYDYPFYATHDVAFYSSWAILQLWPELERQELLQFAATVEQADLSEFVVEATQQRSARKLKGALPHDLGGPRDSPFLRSNAYTWQNINDWKDLNLKYVLRAYRDYLLLDDPALLDQVWPTIPVALEYIRRFDRDGDGLPDHHGPDQTYDTWSSRAGSSSSR